MPDIPDLHAQTDDPLFISYSRANTPFARQLYDDLHGLGFHLWRDRSEMEAGNDWWAQIKAAIDGAGTMVLVMSPKALASPVVAKEWRYARQVGTRVIPVLAEDVAFETVPRWMARLDWLDFRDGAPERDLIWPKFIRQLNMPYEPERVPFMADPLPPDFVLRSAELEAVVGKLLDGGGEPVGITAALRGAGGYGKTTLARAVCHDERMQHAFDGGILWVELGEQPGDPIGRVLDLIVVLSGERPPVTGLEAARSRLAELLADKDILMVIDDIWDSAHLKPFLVAAPRCSRLITTRNTETLPAGAHKINVDAMLPAEAVALLSNGLLDEAISPRPEGEGQGVRVLLPPLAARLGEWPLLLKLANGVLRNRVEKGQSLADALTYVNTALDRRGLTVFDQANSDERSKAVAATIRVSLDLLTTIERNRYGELAIFPEDVDVPLAALEKLWQRDDFETEQLCERLDNLSLLLRFDLVARTIRLHDTLRAYLIAQAGSQIARHGALDKERRSNTRALILPRSDLLQRAGTMPGVQGRFLDAYNLSRWADLPAAEPYLWDWLAYHLIEAARGDQLVSTVKDLHYLAAKTHARDAHAAEADLAAAERYLDAQDADTPATGLTVPPPPLAGEAGRGSLSLLNRQFANMTHLLNRCETLKDVMATLHSRLQHLPELADACADLEGAIPRPFVTAWQPLPDLPHPALVRTIEGHTRALTACAYSPDDRWIVSASYDGTLKLWDAMTGIEKLTLAGHLSWVTACAYSPDGNQIVSASRDRTLKVWNLNDGSVRLTLTGHRDRITACAYSPDGNQIVSASRDRTLKVWQAKDGTVLLTLSGHKGRVTACAYSPDGKEIVSASLDNTVKVWDAHDGTERLSLEGDTDGIIACAYSPDGKEIITASLDNMVKVWDAKNGLEIRAMDGHTHWVTGCTYSHDNRFILSVSRDQTLKIWDTEIRANQLPVKHGTEYVTSCAYSLDGQRVVSGSWDTTLKVWNVKKGVIEHILKGHNGQVEGCAFSPDGKQIVSASMDNTLKVWDVESGLEVSTLTGHTDGVHFCAFSPDGKQIVSASADNTLKVWDVQTLSWAKMLEGHTSGVFGCGFSSDGLHILSASWDKTLKIWDAKTGREQLTLIGHIGSINFGAYSRDDQQIVSASWDKTLKIWDAKTGAEQLTLVGHKAEVDYCLFNPDGQIVISVTWDKILIVWDGKTGVRLATLQLDSELHSCAFHPDGEGIIAGGDAGLYWLRLVR